MAEEWITVKEASELLGISRRQVLNRIHEGKLKARKDNNMWLVHSSLAETDAEVPMEVPSTSKKFQDEVDHLRGQLEQKDKQLEEKDKQIERLHEELTETHRNSADASQRHDTIVLQLTRQLEQSQRMLEAHQEPWYRRLFGKGRKSGES